MSRVAEGISAGRVLAFRIPTTSPESDGTAEWDSTTVVVVQLSAGGQTGIGYSYADVSSATIAEFLVQKEVLGQSAWELPAIHLRMDQAVRNMGRPGVASCAIAAIDNCLWDLKAKLVDQPLLSLLGSSRKEVAAYGSGGFTSYSQSELEKQLTGWAGEGISAVKMKIGREPTEDIERVAGVQKALGGTAELYVDANGAYNRKQALDKSMEFGDLGVVWFEEPVSSDDRDGLRIISEGCPASISVAAGEYGYVLDDFRLLIEAEAVDVLQVDATRCGGVSNFMIVAGVCDMHHLPLSAHTAPTLHATLCCASKRAVNVEYFYDHARIERMIFDGGISPTGGMLRPDLTRAGLGISLKEQDAEPYKIFDRAIPSTSV